ncbi:hypothetical protein NM688_g1921 [Phlebia brevispora]|uniref:Uncharacterized protein n=1 Tax=Phlebia brevispora TaxID=194682 RepID=A0ACC1TA76_9APHY|nr:hypothetical protein NM688_g1921 [Phlebia brevispora]
MHSRLAIVLCIVLHAILVLIYAAILTTYEAGAYNRPLQLSAAAARTAITIISQAFTIAYCAILVLLTQRITLHDLTKRPQTLTAIHDKTSAWLGLGASLQTLVRQTKLVTDLLGISMITLYLLFILVVHTTLPGIFSVTTQNVTIFGTYPTTLARQPNVTPLFMNESETGLTDLYSILQVYDTLNLTTVGVLDNMLYDIIPTIENASGAGAQVNETTITVDCALLPDVVQTSFTSPANGAGTALYTFRFGGGNYSTVIYPIGVNQSIIQGVVTDNLTMPLPNMLVVASTYPVIDAAGVNATTVSINPMWAQINVDNMFNTQQTVIPSINLFGCNFDVHNSTVDVNSRSRALNQSSAPLVLQAFISYAPPYTQAFDMSPDVVVFNATINMTGSSTQLTVLDEFLQIDIATNRNASLYTSGSLTVSELNRSLGRAYAALLWYYNSATLASLHVTFDQTGDRLEGEVSIPCSVLQERLTVNIISLSIGLGASCVLFVLAVAVVLASGDFAKDVVYHDFSGLLPILWFLGNEPCLAAIDQPDLDALRAAGIHEVIGTDQRRRRAETPKIGADSSLGATVEEYELRSVLLGDPDSTDRLVAHAGSMLVSAPSE